MAISGVNTYQNMLGQGGPSGVSRSGGIGGASQNVSGGGQEVLDTPSSCNCFSCRSSSVATSPSSPSAPLYSPGGNPGVAASGAAGAQSTGTTGTAGTNGATGTNGTAGTTGAATSLSPQDKAEIQALKQRDRHVRAHEAAHLAAAGSYARSGATYTYQIGPDGRAYAIGGEVTLDTSTVPNDPQATIAKMEVIEEAALAPSDPSAQDRLVASEAMQAIDDAELQLARQSSSGSSTSGSTSVSSSGSSSGSSSNAYAASSLPSSSTISSMFSFIRMDKGSNFNATA